MYNPIRLGKLDVAKRQLEAAITLFFNYKDDVSIHTLAHASHEILNVLLTRTGGKSYKDQMVEMIKPEYQNEFKKMILNAKTFFKHPGTNPESDVLQFDSGQTEWILWDACDMYFKLTKERVALFLIFDAWLFSKHPKFLDDIPLRNKVIELGYDSNDRKQFLDMLPYFYEISG